MPPYSSVWIWILFIYLFILLSSVLKNSKELGKIGSYMKKINNNYGKSHPYLNLKKSLFWFRTVTPLINLKCCIIFLFLKTSGKEMLFKHLSKTMGLYCKHLPANIIAHHLRTISRHILLRNLDKIIIM